MPIGVQPRYNDTRTATERTVYQVVRFLLSFLIVGIVLFSVLVMYALSPASDDPFALDQVITIKTGMTGRDIAEKLATRGVVRQPHLFQLILRLTGSDSFLKAGSYLLNPTMGAMEIVQQLKTGRVESYQVVIPEGFGLKQIADVLSRQELVNRDRFLALAEDVTSVFGDSFPIAMPVNSLEGYLFPDTYRFAVGQSEEDIIRQMVNRFVEVVIPAVEGYSRSELSLHEIVTLASIVEREVMVNRERPVVAAVYLNRLKVDMPLQADPTVRYVMEDDRSRVLYKDLEIDSPYNTYRHRGLPPGPIASPGLASILAVLEPADVDYLYFVSRRDGTHQFSRTFNEHVRARRELGY